MAGQIVTGLRPGYQGSPSSYNTGPASSNSGLTSTKSTRVINPTAWHGGGTDIIDNSAEIAERAAQARLQTLKPYLNQLFASGQGGGGIGAEPPEVNAPGLAGNEQAARAAAFARAKDQAGQTARSSLTALEGLMANRGQAGSGLEGALSSDIISGGAGRVNEFTREQLMQDLNRAAEVSNRNYAGAITQRGQDISSRNQSLSALLQLINSIY